MDREAVLVRERRHESSGCGQWAVIAASLQGTQRSLQVDIDREEIDALNRDVEEVIENEEDLSAPHGVTNS